MRTVLKNVIIFGALMAFCLSAALAQAKTTEAGTFYLTPKVGMYGSTNKNISSMFTYGGEAGFFVIDGLSLGVEALGYVIYQKKIPLSSATTYEYVNAFSPIVMARYHFMLSDKASIFGGIGLGGFFSGVKVPRNGYTSNLTEVGEVGFDFAVTDMISLQLAGRYQHIGDFSNKGSDNLGGNFGVKFAF